MSASEIVALIVAVAITGYLVFALVSPERL
ncbi:MAG: potassium-transporting ATPase subunit F [Actinobacteria bacterium]|nr:potassium-transporting ATPase subunit F [Actinomycetota bacterium]